tara:strand:- start:975 stop:2012 length:1038 start_codon:yes stop_codon:yes gene_type:complete
MALLGTGGTLELSREWPKPMALRPDALNASASILSIGSPNYWTGDRIIIASADGLPIDANGDGYADCPEGHGIYYGSIYDLGPARVHVTAASDGYYQTDNNSDFYNTTATTGLLEQSNAYINMDDLDRAKLYNTEIAAYNADSGELLDLKSVKINNLVVARYSSSASYTTGITSAINSIKPLTLPSTTQELKDVITVPAAMITAADDPEQRGWLIQCDLNEWALSVDAANLDMTAIGEVFGENVKALVRGSGTLQFLLDNRVQDGEQTSMTLLRLVMLTERGSKSSAKFHVYRNRTPVSPQVGNTAYYGCDVLLTNSRINVRADDIITGTADFVATGDIALKFSP